MQYHPLTNYFKQNMLQQRFTVPSIDKPLSHRDRIRKELREAGVSRLGLMTEEGRYLPNIIHLSEAIKGVVYGKHELGFAMLVATDKRVIFLDKKPLFTNEDEISFDMVSGLSFDRTSYRANVILHTRIKDYAIRTFNIRCAERFVGFIESRCLERSSDYRRWQ